MKIIALHSQHVLCPLRADAFSEVHIPPFSTVVFVQILEILTSTSNVPLILSLKMVLFITFPKAKLNKTRDQKKRKHEELRWEILS